MSVFWGVDPGQRGALAALDERGQPLDVWDLAYAGNDLDVVWLAGILAEFDGPAFAAVERQLPLHPAGRRAGLTSTFENGRNYGALLATFALLGIPVHDPTPSQWKRSLRLGRDKGAAVALARKLFPTISLRTPRGRALDGRAEALLLAEFGRRRHL